MKYIFVVLSIASNHIHTNSRASHTLNYLYNMATITSAAEAAIAAASPGESKENTLLNKTQALIQNMGGKEGAFREASLQVASFYHLHPLTISLTEGEVPDWRFWLPIDLFEWRWWQKIQELFPWWEPTHNTAGHYTIVPDEFVPPQERRKTCEAILREPTFYTYFNLPYDPKKITYWDLFVEFSQMSTADEVAREMDKKQVHPEVREFIIHRGYPGDLEKFVRCWAEEDPELHKNWQKWGQRGIEIHILKVTEKITGITLEEWKKKNPPPKLMRQATWFGKFYPLSNACPPRERAHVEGGDIPFMVEVHAPELLPKLCRLKESGPKDNPTWKQKGLPAGLEWMIDVIWANLTPTEREELGWMVTQWGIDNNSSSVSVDQWLHLQLLHNFGECFTAESKRKVNRMLIPRTAKW